MSGGGGGGGDDGVKYQRQQEEARQARIREGMQRIDELFNGRDVTTNSAQKVAFDPYWGTQPGTYYDANGTPITFTNKNQRREKGSAAKKSAPRGKNADEFDNRQTSSLGTGISVNTPRGRIMTPTELYATDPRATAVTKHVGGFGDDFFNKRATAYQDFALPQVQQQYGDQQKALTFALARGGNLRSSLANDKNAELDKDFTLQKQAVYDTGRDYANQGRADMAQQKASAVSMLQASADPDAAYNVAQTSANQLSAMPAFTPLTGVVKNVASGLGTYLNNQSTAEAIAKAQAAQGGGYSLPASWSGSGKVGG